MLFLFEGESTQQIDFDQFTLHSNQIMFMYPGQVHAYQYQKHVEGYTLYFTGDFINNSNSCIYTLHQFFFNQPQVINIKKSDQQVLRTLLKQLLQEFSEHNLNKREALKAYTELLLTTFLRIVSYNVSFSEITSNKDFFKLLKLIDQYANTALKMHTIEKEVGISQKQLNLLTKQYFGKTFFQVLNEKKVLEIKKQLSTTTLAIKEIAYSNGFSDTSHLNHFFKKKVGVTPIQFRTLYVNKRNCFKG
jgi:AraC-like DNA-binding protein